MKQANQNEQNLQDRRAIFPKAYHNYLHTLERAYDGEFELRSGIYGRVGPFFTTFTLLTGAIAFYATKIPLYASGPLYFALLGLLIASIVSSFIALIFITRIFIGHDYKHLPSVDILDDRYFECERIITEYNQEADGYNKQVPDEQLAHVGDNDVIESMEATLAEWYRTCAITNRKLNIKRSKLYHRGVLCLAVAGFATLLSAAPFFYLTVAPEPTVSQPIHSSKEGNQMIESEDNLTADPESENVSVPEKPPKPVIQPLSPRAPVESINEGKQPERDDIPSKINKSEESSSSHQSK